MDISNNLKSNNLNTSGVAQTQFSQENFMKMLLAQLKMQNPLNPFDASTMMQQISQLTGLSASQKLADSVDALKGNLGTSQMLEATSLVGKNVQLSTDKLELADGREANGAVLVPPGVEAIDVSVTDSSGKILRTLKLHANSDGVMDFSWDGKDEAGAPLAPGFYQMSAVGHVGTEQVNVATAANFKVSSVALDRASGKVVLNVNGLGGVSMNEIVKIL